MSDTPRTDVEALAEAIMDTPWEDDDHGGLHILTYAHDMGHYRDVATAIMPHLPAGWRLTNEAADERLRAAVRAWVDYWDARTELWDAVGKCGHDPTADCPEMDALRAQGTDDKYDHELRAALAATEDKR